MRRVSGVSLVAAVALLVVAAEVTQPENGSGIRRPVAAVPVSDARLVCPPLVADENTASRVFAALPPADSAPPGSDPVRIDTVGRAPAPLAAPALTLPGRWTSAPTPPGPQRAVEVSAAGVLAPGLAAAVVVRGSGGIRRGLSGAACLPAQGDGWFIGASTAVGRSADLFAVNPDELPAVLDLELFGPEGPVDAPTGRGIRVPARGMTTVHLEELAPDTGPLLVHATSRTGRAAVSVRVADRLGTTPLGVDHLPLVDGPARRSVTPGFPAGSGERHVVIGNPGTGDATLELRLVTSDGSFVPTGLQAVALAAGATKSIDVAEALRGQAGGVFVTSDEPVVVGTTIATGPRTAGIGETAWSAAVPPLTSAAVAGPNGIGGARATLLLTAPEGDASVAVETLNGPGLRGPSVRKVVRVRGGATLEVGLPQLFGTSDERVVAVSPLPGSGPVYAARLLLEVGSRGLLYTIMPLRSMPRTVTPRAVGFDLEAGVRGP